MPKRSVSEQVKSGGGSVMKYPIRRETVGGGIKSNYGAAGGMPRPSSKYARPLYRVGKHGQR